MNCKNFGMGLLIDKYNFIVLRILEILLNVIILNFFWILLNIVFFFMFVLKYGLNLNGN